MSELPIDLGTGKPMPPREQPGYYPGFSTVSQKAYWDAATRAVVLRRLEQPKPLRFFTAAEAVTMEAVTARVMPQEDRIASRRIPVLAGIDERLAENRIDGYRYEDMPADQEAYRLGVLAFETMAQEQHAGPFAGLTVMQQEELLKSLNEGKPFAAKELWAGMNVQRFWSMLVGDCCAVYYAHPWAWDEIGFGGPSYPRGYMRLEGGEPEPWEVEEQRYEWAPPPDTLSAEEQGSEHTHAENTPGQGGTH
ncbi:gluconate 2-dehydrogenase subunit 3 family protein [Granulicella tundricola]|uniref:Gluconate 2-dehydrogenase subunit 3 family protein n=1 Tax=Granulicella tundricola (strain ATCC BAA-1859 / DSM 23138 / MP5ACTX9) TaxID=1198114 RepID=E8X746_GRATM|nr:gluconate 2-dehydrogenase subunit 3 family protein [Granulicella tundricola]ADW71280.1 hypothetical protein AciX9_4327 [Granulicella tundricola MP5ACTX9]